MGREPEETRMGTFLLISVLIHMAVLLFAPQLSNRAGAQLPSLFSGGVVQVVRVDEPVASQRTTPQRVAPERRPAPAQRQAPQPEPPAEPRPQREPAPPAETQPEPEPTIQAPVPSTAADTPLTSPQGADPVQEAPKTQAAAAPDPKPATRTAAPAESRERAAPADAGSSPTPEPASEPVPEDPGPPALPPLGEPGSLINLGTSSLGYPKNAENLGLEGAVEVRLELDETGRVQRILPVQLSGHRVLDEYALQALTVLARQQRLTGSRQAAPYAVHARVTFQREGNQFVGHVELVGAAEYLQER